VPKAILVWGNIWNHFRRILDNFLFLQIDPYTWTHFRIELQPCTAILEECLYQTYSSYMRFSYDDPSNSLKMVIVRHFISHSVALGGSRIQEKCVLDTTSILVKWHILYLRRKSKNMNYSETICSWPTWNNILIYISVNLRVFNRFYFVFWIILLRYNICHLTSILVVSNTHFSWILDPPKATEFEIECLTLTIFGLFEG